MGKHWSLPQYKKDEARDRVLKQYKDKGIDLIKRQKEIEQVYIETGSLLQTGAKFGLSRERIRQIIHKSKDPKVFEVWKRNRHLKKRDRLKENCLGCKRSFFKIKYFALNRCYFCYKRFKGIETKVTQLGIKRRSGKNGNYNKNCSKCGVDIEKGEFRKYRSSGMCRKCYAKARWYHPMVGSRLHLYHRKRHRKKMWERRLSGDVKQDKSYGRDK